MSFQVLVYGSLRQGMGNDIRHFARHAKADMTMKGTTQLQGALMRSLTGFPAISFPEEGAGYAVIGEVYEITSNEKQMLASLDRLEGYPSFYDRKEVDTEFGKAWVYFFHEDRPNLPLVENGDWVDYKNSGGAGARFA